MCDQRTEKSVWTFADIRLMNGTMVNDSWKFSGEKKGELWYNQRVKFEIDAKHRSHWTGPDFLFLRIFISQKYAIFC